MDNEEYIGDIDNMTEEIDFYSKRIQKFNVFSSIQQKDVFQNYSNYNNYEIIYQIKHDKLFKDIYIQIDDFYNYEVDRKKNYILGKELIFSYHYAYLFKLIEKGNGFPEFIEILKDKPNTEELYTIFLILDCCFPYLHKGYFIENIVIIKTSLLDYIKDLNKEEEIHKYFIELAKNLLYNISSLYLEENDNNKSSSIHIYDEVTIKFYLKAIKTSNFELRFAAIKFLDDYILKNKENKDTLKTIIGLIKESKIITEMFGTNYNSQIIREATGLVKNLFVENELGDDEIKLC